MKIITQNQVLKELEDGLRTQSRCVIVEYTNNQVNYGFDDKPNFEYCRRYDIACVDIGRRGGTFVVNKGDIGFGYITKGLDNTVGNLLYNKFAEYLKSRGLNAETKNNDVLVDGYKVFGWASHYYKEYDAIYITAHFTLTVDVELIKNVCTKPMNKVPRGLTDFGIMREDIIDFLNSLNIC
jgi:lipoate-protein ligase A